MPISTFQSAPVEEIIHGVVVRDPYRWLEDRTLPETQEWIEEQQRRHDDYFASCGDLEAIRKRVREYLDIEVVDQPAKVGNRYFYRRRNRGQEQASIYTRNGVTGIERLLVDPSHWGLFTSVGIYRISSDGSLLAYEVRHGGQDKRIICFLDVKTGVTLSGRIESGYARGLVFNPDNLGYYYCHETCTDSQEHKILLHLFHESVADQIVFHAARSRESRLILTADKVHLGAIWIHRRGSDLVVDFFIAKQKDPLSWRQVLIDRELPFTPIMTNGRLLSLTYVHAPNGKVIELDEDGRELRTIIPEQDAMIRRVVTSGNRIYIHYLRDLVPSLHIRDLLGFDLGEIVLPGDGTIQLLPNHNEEDVFFYTYESFMQPLITFEHISDSPQATIWHRPALQLTPPSIQVRHIEYGSSVGARIPMTLMTKKSRITTPMGGPVIMTSYGGFGISMTPQFSVLATVLLELGILFATPHIRGGGDFGNAWHEAARGKNRQISFDDFLRAAEFLCDEGITSPQQLAIVGGSNAGLLVGAAFTQRPDLFRAALCIARCSIWYVTSILIRLRSGDVNMGRRATSRNSILYMLTLLIIG
jgi:prolyl oligopeptidase